MIGRIVIALAVASLPAAVSAGQAEICYSAPVNFALYQPPSNATVFVCPVAGSRTLPQLAADGWEIVQLGPLTTGYSADPAQTQYTDQLVIQKR
jgi:hypothetical protein